METTAPTAFTKLDPPGIQQAWQMVASQLRMEMRRSDYETWVEPLRPLGFNEGIYRLGAHNSYALDWVESRLRSRIARLLEGVLNQEITLRFSIISDGQKGEAAQKVVLPASIPSALSSELPLLDLQSSAEVPPVETPSASAPVVTPVQPEIKKNGTKKGNRTPVPPSGNGDVPQEKGVGESGGSPRKIQLQRAYGTERARVVQPERGMFVTNYLFANWLPLLGHSAFAAILAARSLCYWNPMTGELRNVVETDIGELAKRANVSVRTMKEVLNLPQVKQYFMRYKVRRMMTANGVRTAGILLQVRMDDPLTPEDQASYHLQEEERWYAADFEDETEE
jgi:hypothetical protein